MKFREFFSIIYAALFLTKPKCCRLKGRIIDPNVDVIFLIYVTS